MHNIEYEIKLNEQGRPCISIPENHENNPEDKFFAIELARYLLQDTYGRRSPEFDKETAWAMDVAIRSLGQIGDEMARILWHNMKASGDAQFILGADFHVMCDSIEERDKISDRGILYYDKLYVRQEGLKVLTKDTDDIWKIFELKGGTTNDNWERVS